MSVSDSAQHCLTQRCRKTAVRNHQRSLANQGKQRSWCNIFITYIVQRSWGMKLMMLFRSLCLLVAGTAGDYWSHFTHLLVYCQCNSGSALVSILRQIVKFKRKKSCPAIIYGTTPIKNDIIVFSILPAVEPTEFLISSTISTVLIWSILAKLFILKLTLGKRKPTHRDRFDKKTASRTKNSSNPHKTNTTEFTTLCSTRQIVNLFGNSSNFSPSTVCVSWRVNNIAE